MIPSTATSAVKPATGPIFLLRHLAQRFPVAADGRAQDDEVLHGAAEHDADDDPEHTGQIAELGGERGADERARSGDGGEVVAEDDPAVRRREVAPVVQAIGGGEARIVEGKDARRDERAVEAIPDGVGQQGRDEQPRRADLLAAREARNASAPAPATATSDQPSTEATRLGGPVRRGSRHAGQLAGRTREGQHGRARTGEARSASSLLPCTAVTFRALPLLAVRTLPRLLWCVPLLLGCAGKPAAQTPTPTPADDTGRPAIRRARRAARHRRSRLPSTRRIRPAGSPRSRARVSICARSTTRSARSSPREGSRRGSSRPISPGPQSATRRTRWIPTRSRLNRCDRRTSRRSPGSPSRSRASSGR